MAGEHTVDVATASWQDEVMQSTVPVLVDFWAEWCAPCRTLGPILDELAAEWQGRLKVAKVDVDQSPDLAAQFQIRSIPALFLIQDGTVREQMMGMTSKADLQAKLETHLD